MLAERWGYSITFASLGGALLLSALCLLLFLRE